MSLDDEWSQWSRDYRRSPGGPLAADAARIVERASRDAWMHLLKTATDIAGTLFAIVVFLVISTKSPSVWPFASVAVAGFVVSLAHSLHVRQGTWVIDSRAVTAFVELAWRRKRADVRLIVFGRVLFAVLVVGYALWLPYMLSSRSEVIAERPLRTVVGLSFSLILFVGAWFYVQHKLHKERRSLAKLAELRAALEDEPRPSVQL